MLRLSPLKAHDQQGAAEAFREKMEIESEKVREGCSRQQNLRDDVLSMELLSTPCCLHSSMPKVGSLKEPVSWVSFSLRLCFV